MQYPGQKRRGTNETVTRYIQPFSQRNPRPCVALRAAQAVAQCRHLDAPRARQQSAGAPRARQKSPGAPRARQQSAAAPASAPDEHGCRWRWAAQRRRGCHGAILTTAPPQTQGVPCGGRMRRTTPCRTPLPKNSTTMTLHCRFAYAGFHRVLRHQDSTSDPNKDPLSETLT